jgi:chemotaxis signal transduction protein
MREAWMGDLDPAKTPAWVVRLRQAAIGNGASEAETTEAAVLNLAASVAPDEPVWAQDLVRGKAEALGNRAETEAPTSVDVETAARFTVCQVGAQRLAIAVDHVLEVRPGRRYTALPGMAAFVRGVANIQGEAVPVIGLGQLLGIEATANPIWERLLLVKPPGQTRVIGLVVDRVLDLKLLRGPWLAEAEPEGALAGFLTQESELDGELVRVLDVAALLRSGLIETLAQIRRENR